MSAKPIFTELCELRRDKLNAGESAKSITLSREQLVRLKSYCDDSEPVFVDPFGQKRRLRGIRFSDGMILGMRFNHQDLPA